jgi:hypothetical protein
MKETLELKHSEDLYDRKVMMVVVQSQPLTLVLCWVLTEL